MFGTVSCHKVCFISAHWFTLCLGLSSTVWHLLTAPRHFHRVCSVPVYPFSPLYPLCFHLLAFPSFIALGITSLFFFPPLFSLCFSFSSCCLSLLTLTSFRFLYCLLFSLPHLLWFSLPLVYLLLLIFIFFTSPCFSLQLIYFSFPYLSFIFSCFFSFSLLLFVSFTSYFSLHLIFFHFPYLLFNFFCIYSPFLLSFHSYQFALLF